MRGRNLKLPWIPLEERQSDDAGGRGEDRVCGKRGRSPNGGGGGGDTVGGGGVAWRGVRVKELGLLGLSWAACEFVLINIGPPSL